MLTKLERERIVFECIFGISNEKTIPYVIAKAQLAKDVEWEAIRDKGG